MKKTVFKIIAFLTALCMAGAVLTSCGEVKRPTEGIKVAEIVASSGVNDGSFNYLINKVCTSFCKENNIPFRYYVAGEDSTDSYLSLMDAAIDDDYNVVICNSSMSRAVKIASKSNPDVKFIAIDVSDKDIVKNEELPKNICCSVFDEGCASFMAGYAAVTEGYRKLGFVGGIPVASVIRFGYGFLQGINAAAKEMGITDEISVDYVYANQFFGDSDITAYMENWYVNKKIQVVFACGGKVWTSVASAAKSVDGRVIGVDSDQDDEINSYTGKKTALCSAMKNLDAALKYMLKKTMENKWNEIGGKFFTLGIVNGEDPEENFVKISHHDELMKNFTKEDYKKLIAKIYIKEFTVSNDITKKPDVSIKVNYAGNIK